jgi:hypothetical protein
MSAESAYNAWREKPSLTWQQIVNPVNRTHPGDLDLSEQFKARWQRVADLANEEIARIKRARS